MVDVGPHYQDILKWGDVDAFSLGDDRCAVQPGWTCVCVPGG